MDSIALEKTVTAANYDPLPVVLREAKGVWVTDVDGKRYLDMMSAYSAVSLGHGHPRILKAMTEQARRLAVTSRAYHTELLGAVPGAPRRAHRPRHGAADEYRRRSGRDRHQGGAALGLPLQGHPEGQRRNHRRRTTISMAARPRSSASPPTNPTATDFGPFSGGFRTVPFGDAQAVADAITPNTCAVLIEPIQGEAGIVVPPDGYLRDLRAICDRHGVLLILDEVQSGLGRTGRWFAHQHEDIRPDGLILGKALGGGVYPVSAFVATREVMSVFDPGLAWFDLRRQRAGRADRTRRRSRHRGRGPRGAQRRTGRAISMERLRAMRSNIVNDVRGNGLWVGVEIDPAVRLGPRRLRRACWRRASFRRTRTAPSCASRRRSPSRATKSTGEWSASNASSPAPIH